MKLTVLVAWKKRDALRTEGTKFMTQGAEMWIDENKIKAEDDKIRSEGAKLMAQGDMLKAQADTLWAEAVIARFGNIMLAYEYDSKKDDSICRLENGEIYKPLKKTT